MPALGYGRKSFVRREVDAVSVDKQRLAVERRAVERNESLIWFEDAEGHRSGRYERTRPGYLKLLARLENDLAVSAVLFYELDRAARSVIAIDKIVKICQARHIAFVCIKEGIDTTRGLGADEIFKIQLLASLAEREANKVGERMREIAQYYHDELRIQWGMWPFGYSRVGEGKHATFVPKSPLSETSLRLFGLYVAGNGYGEVADQLNKLGYVHIGRHGQSKPFNRETVRTIIGNVLFYAGYIVGVQQHAKQAVVQLQGEGSYLERYARAMSAERALSITPLIDEDTANAVIERRSKNEWTGRKSMEWTALLTPIAYWQDRKLRAQVMYTGHWYRTYGRGASFDGDAIDAEMISGLRDTEFPDVARADIRHAVEDRIGDTRRKQLAGEETALLAEMELLFDLLSGKRIQRETYDSRYITAERRLHEVRLRMNAPTDADKVMMTLTDLGRGIDLMTQKKRKQAVSHVFERVDIDDAGVIDRVHFRPWARAAFMDIAAVLQIMPPVSAEHLVCKSAWLIAKAA